MYIHGNVVQRSGLGINKHSELGVHGHTRLLDDDRVHEKTDFQAEETDNAK